MSILKQRATRLSNSSYIPDIASYIGLSAISLLGFFIAILVSLFFKQTAEAQISTYPLGSSLSITADEAYRFVLAALILIYGAAAVYSFWGEERRKQFLSRVPFRFVIGLALALWDILGTKLLLLPQPFFPDLREL